MKYWDDSVRLALRPLKHCCHVNPAVLLETTDPDWEFDYIDIGSVSLSEGVTHKERMRFAASPSRARKPVREGDILVSTVRTYLKAIAAVETADTPQVASTGFAVLRASKGTDARFLYRVVQSNPFVEQVVSRSTGVSYPAINPSTLSNIEVPLPDLATQRQIADFLDRETARIDLLIEKKQRLVALLGEKLSSFTERLVAFGPDSAFGKIKTGNIWLPAVSKGVELLPIKRVARLINGYAFSSDDLGDEGVPVIRIGDVGFSIDTEGAKKFTGVPSRNLDQFVVQRGDILIAMTGATIGKFGVYENDAPAYLNQRVGILRAKDIDRRYLSNCLGTRTFVEQMKLFAYGGAQPNIGAGEIGSIVIPVPSREVQEVIADLVEDRKQNLSATSVAVQTSIDRLKEYRSALITAAVTGQIDVSTYAKSGTSDRRLHAIQEVMGA